MSVGASRRRGRGILARSRARDVARARRRAGDFEAWWRQTLEDGVVADSAAAKRRRRRPRCCRRSPPATRRTRFTLVLAPDPVGLGRQHRQQRLAAGMSEAAHQAGLGQRAPSVRKPTAALGLVDGDVVRLHCAQARIEAPVLRPARAGDGTIAATLGYGRTQRGPHRQRRRI